MVQVNKTSMVVKPAAKQAKVVSDLVMVQENLVMALRMVQDLGREQEAVIVTVLVQRDQVKREVEAVIKNKSCQFRQNV
jgi:hypothetical protein